MRVSWLALLPALACADIERPSSDFPQCAPAEPTPAPEAPSYWGDAKTIIDAKCVGCHRAAGAAPFSLESYEEVLRNLEALRDAIAAGRMPPWPPSDCCQTYAHRRSLDPTERDTLIAWIEAAAPEGERADVPGPSEPALHRVDLTLTMREAFSPVTEIGGGELRCFLLDDWPYRDEVFVTGFAVRPSNPQLVHRVVTRAIPDYEADDLADQDGADGRPGFACGVAGVAHHGGTGTVGVWALGMPPFESLDASLGMKVPARSRLLVEIHYGATSAAIGADRSAFEFAVSDRVDHELKQMVVTHPLWAVGDGLTIRAGDADAERAFAFDPTVVETAGDAFYVHAMVFATSSQRSVAVSRSS